MPRVTVTLEKGTKHLKGSIETNSYPLDGSLPEVVIDLDDGRQIRVPFTTLSRREDGSYMVELGSSEGAPEHATSHADSASSVVIPVMVEEVAVSKRTVEKGRVRITKQVHEREELIDEALSHDEVSIERVPINRFVEEPIPPRYEGDTIIVSLLEEVAVIEKRLLLKEELRITRRPVEGRKPFSVTLRREEATVEYIKPQETNEISSAKEKSDGKDRNRPI